MNFKRTISTLGRYLGINLLTLLAAAFADILLSAVLLRFSSHALTIACFAVAGVFAAVFCFGLTENTIPQEKKRMAGCILVITIPFCAALFFVIAPLSGREYNWPVKFFAMAQLAAGFFLWKNKLYDDAETSGSNSFNNP
ncbi:hypothetical protein [Niabella drilacis]|uniref:Uncharacterized protein n=1 Tax=Niabella drilacis (strain DSM 25811 / CCM 8410 / CCUG 62505 / LMG 26954 / E90) TaxID=1285928 RepID=A0A1G7B8V5_NIADE|nr:hypothetical protein [Niabella drilacis]SDE23471.1 hypothetical protein SAMN04487894_12817 [Niabella drilacis]